MLPQITNCLLPVSYKSVQLSGDRTTDILTNFFLCSYIDVLVVFWRNKCIFLYIYSRLFISSETFYSLRGCCAWRHWDMYKWSSSIYIYRCIVTFVIAPRRWRAPVSVIASRRVALVPPRRVALVTTWRVAFISSGSITGTMYTLVLGIYSKEAVLGAAQLCSPMPKSSNRTEVIFEKIELLNTAKCGYVPNVMLRRASDYPP